MKSSLTRDELNHLFSFFNIMCIVMYISKKTLPVQLKDPQTKSKTLIQEGQPGEEEREVAKSKRMWHFVSKIVDLFSKNLGSSISQPGALEAQCSNFDVSSTRKLVSRNLNENRALCFQVWQPNVNPNTNTGHLWQKRQRIQWEQDYLTTT